ncbi:MAG: hypothetical protein KJ077_13780 [Anaerolineae bacterium]|nr:hypothetical protein [Anaerolineae bacterium]
MIVSSLDLIRFESALLGHFGQRGEVSQDEQNHRRWLPLPELEYGQVVKQLSFSYLLTPPEISKESQTDNDAQDGNHRPGAEERRHPGFQVFIVLIGREGIDQEHAQAHPQAVPNNSP